jgi:hemerythrin superfamily protein
MAKTTVTSPTDVVEFLIDQHERIKSLFDTTLASSGSQRKAAFLTLRRLLAVHETGEEEIVHPRARRKLANGREVVWARLAEEHEAKVALAKLEKLDVDSEEFTAQLSELRNAVVEHAEYEEKEEFCELKEKLTPHELQLMARATRIAEAIAPTRPHPGVESQIANLMVGPFAAMLDRARDAILGIA